MYSPTADSSSSSTTLIIDLVSKFISKMFCNDPNQTHYIKQWNSFRDLLSAVPFDLNPIFSYIANVSTAPGNFSAPQTPLKLHRPIHSINTAPNSPGLFKGFNYLDSTSLNGSNYGSPIFTEGDEPGDYSLEAPKHRRAYSTRNAAVGNSPNLQIISPSKYALSKNQNTPFLLPSYTNSPALGSDAKIVSIPEDEPFEVSGNNRSYRVDTEIISSPRTPSVPNFEPTKPVKSHRHTTSVSVESPNGSVASLFKPIGSSIPGVSNYNLSFITGVCRRFRDTHDRNSDTLIDTMLNKNKTLEDDQEDSKGRRKGSPLRKMTIFEKKDGQQPQQPPQRLTFDIAVPKLQPFSTPMYTELKVDNFTLTKTPSYSTGIVYRGENSIGSY